MPKFIQLKRLWICKIFRNFKFSVDLAWCMCGWLGKHLQEETVSLAAGVLENPGSVNTDVILRIRDCAFRSCDSLLVRSTPRMGSEFWATTLSAKLAEQLIDKYANALLYFAVGPQRSEDLFSCCGTLTYFQSLVYNLRRCIMLVWKTQVLLR
eukprot:838948-Amphidinium_carterae.1